MKRDYSPLLHAIEPQQKSESAYYALPTDPGYGKDHATASG
jgi:hypothetical protein